MLIPSYSDIIEIIAQIIKGGEGIRNSIFAFSVITIWIFSLKLSVLLESQQFATFSVKIRKTVEIKILLLTSCSYIELLTT